MNQTKRKVVVKGKNKNTEELSLAPCKGNPFFG